MSTTVPPRVSSKSGKSPARPAKRPGGTNRAEIPVLIRLPDLKGPRPASPSAAVAGATSVAHEAHAERGDAPATRGTSDSERWARRESAAVSGSFWTTVAGKAILAVLLSALALACYALISGESSVKDDGSGLDVVWPEASPGEPVGAPLWHEPLAAEPIPTKQEKASEVAKSSNPVDPQREGSNDPPITPPFASERAQGGPANDPALPHLNHAGSDLNPYLPKNNSEPAPSLANPYHSEQRYTAGGADSNGESSSQAWAPDTSTLTRESPSPAPASTPIPRADSEASRSANTWSTNQSRSSDPPFATQPSGGSEQPYAYPNTGIPPLDLRHATRPLERAAQLPSTNMPSGQYNHSAPQGVLQGTIQNPPLRPQNERTGSGLY
jgi:hypothetical protein